MSGPATVGKAALDERYRALLDVSTAIAEQPTVDAILHSLRGLLSSVAALHGAELFLLNEDRISLRLVAADRAPDAPPIATGVQIPLTPALKRVVEDQGPLYVPEVAADVQQYPDLAGFAAATGKRSAYVFPVSTARKQYGVLAFHSRARWGVLAGASGTDGVRCITRCCRAQSALATVRAEQYQRELAETLASIYSGNTWIRVFPQIIAASSRGSVF